jgi:hypothetical protein
MSIGKRIAVGFVSVIIGFPAFAYETSTHEILIEKAVRTSVIATTPSLLNDYTL